MATFKDLDENIVYKKLICRGMFSMFIDDIFTTEKFGEYVLANPTKSELRTNRLQEFSLMPYKITKNNNHNLKPKKARYDVRE